MPGVLSRNDPANLRRVCAYAAALCATALALWITFVVPVLDERTPFLLLVAAVTVSAFLGGTGPAILAGCAAVLGHVWMVIPRQGLQTDSLVRLLLFVAVAGLISFLSASARRAADRARDQRRWLEVTISSIGDAVIETNSSGVVQLLNSVAETLTGWSNNEAVGIPVRDVFKIIEEDTRAPIENAADCVLNNVSVAGLGRRTILLSRTGVEVPIDQGAAPIRDDRGMIMGAILVFRDVSQRRRSEQELFESEERLRLAQEAGRMGTWDWNIATGKLTWSGDIQSLQGFPADHFDGNFESYLQVVHPDDRDRLAETIREALKDKSPLDVEFRVMKPDGITRWLAGKGQVFLGPEGRPSRMIGIGTDVTDRKKAEDALRASEERFSKAFNSSPLPKWIGKSGTGEIVDVNEAFLRSTGYEREEVLGRVPGQFGLWADGSDDDRLAEIVRSNVRARDLELKFRRKSGQLRVFLLSVERITLDGEPCFLAVGSDITERKQAEDALRESEERFRLMAVENVRLLLEAQEANRAKDEFLATVSHELRTPLNSILGWATMLNSGRLDQANAGRALEIIERNARVQAQLIEDLLDISRIISGKLRLDVRSVDLVSVIEAAVDALSFAAESKGIRIRCVLDSGVGLISGDPDRLQQVVWNLLTNAIKFTPKNGRVQVRLEKAGATAEIIVSDTGMGISPDFLPHVFERFRQLDSSSTRKHGGLGLGLAIVSQLVELHGGSIRVESPGKGEGATFTVSLPLVAAASASGEEPPRVRVAAGGPEIAIGPVLEGVRVLLVEDEQGAREILAVALRQCGAHVMVACSASEALEILNGERALDVLVSEIEMPGEDGYALMRSFRALEAERGGRVPAAALTAHARSEDRMRALTAGFQVHIPKPVEPAELVAVVASLSGRTSLARARL